jgi:hypothetical protein
MKIKLIVIDLELSARAKRIAAAVAIPLVVLGGGAVAYANVPHTWKDGDLLTAKDLNGNFDDLDGRVAALDQRITKVEALSAKQTSNGNYSIGATYCGATANTPGDLSGINAAGGGYAKAAAACRSTCSSPTAHMCTADELVRTKTLTGGPGASGWYATGVFAPRVNAASDWIMDCVSWANGTTDREGPVWVNYGAASSTCDAANPVLCCD